MTIVDERIVAAPADACHEVAADVERWPLILPHYRWVKFVRKDAFGTGCVEMSAWRDFAGPLRYPAWWVSEMTVDMAEPAIHFTHVAGITRGMVVKWSFERRGANTHIRITHSWRGPAWPLVGGVAWRWLIAPHFVSFIARRTLAGVGRAAEERSAAMLAEVGDA